MKYIILIAVTLMSCATQNKIAVQNNKYGPVHMQKYNEVNGRYYVKGKEVHLIPGTQVYGAK